MKTHLVLAATATLLLAAAPAIASEEYQTGPALNLSDRVPAADTGSAQYQPFDGPTIATMREQIVARNAAEAPLDSANSLPATHSRITQR